MPARLSPDTADRVRSDGGSFPATRHSVIRALAAADAAARQRAFDTVAATYWKPVYKYIRLKWNAEREDAEDLTQEFFADALQKGWLERYDASRSRFRTYLRTCVDGSVANRRKAARCLKRGGKYALVSMDFAAAESELLETVPAPDANLDELFRQEWIRSLFELAIDRLRTECAANDKARHFTLFVRYDVQAPSEEVRLTYADLAREFELPETQVTNYLAFARRRFRWHVLQALTELTGNADEYAEAARDLLGIDIR
jgi:RNA polymerase sigma factor (sigma-70 family)